MSRTFKGTMLAVVLCVAAMPAFAGSVIVGSVAGTMNATVGGQPLAPDTVVFSGDSLKVKDGAAVIALSNNGRLVFGQETEASFLREGNGVTVMLDKGHVSLYQSETSTPVQVKVGSLWVLPAKGYTTLGEVAMMGDGVVITAKEGALRVEGKGAPVEVARGKSVFIKDGTARAAQGGTMQKMAGGGNEMLEAGALGAGVVAAILAGIGISRAGDAKTAALAAGTTAGQANSSAQAALSAAQQANSNAILAISAANSAASAANNAGCAVNNLNDASGLGVVPSPYTPPAGYTCPPFVPAM